MNLPALKGGVLNPLANKVFADAFDKPSVETIAAINKALEALEPYLNGENVQKLLSLFGMKGEEI